MKVASKKQGRMIVGGVVLGGILLGMTAMACYINRVGDCPRTWQFEGQVWELVGRHQTFIYVEECKRSSSEIGYMDVEEKSHEECLYRSPKGKYKYRYYLKRAYLRSNPCYLPPCPGSSSS